MKSEIYISTDVETDGPIPGPNSMLSFGSAAFLPSGNMIGTFQANLKTLDGASGHPDTMEWWSKNPEAYAAATRDPQDPTEALMRYTDWVETMPGSPVFVAYPAGFDFLFMYWYLMRFVGRSPFSFSALDIKSYACAVLKCGYRSATKKNFPRAWFGDHRHNHEALSDAVEQGELFINMMKQRVRL